jgi:hypothetical protein
MSVTSKVQVVGVQAQLASTHDLLKRSGVRQRRHRFREPLFALGPELTKRPLGPGPNIRVTGRKVGANDFILYGVIVESVPNRTLRTGGQKPPHIEFSRALILQVFPESLSDGENTSFLASDFCDVYNRLNSRRFSLRVRFGTDSTMTRCSAVSHFRSG